MYKLERGRRGNLRRCPWTETRRYVISTALISEVLEDMTTWPIRGASPAQPGRVRHLSLLTVGVVGRQESAYLPPEKY